MWLLFGLIAIISAILNVIRAMQHRDAKWFRHISLSFTVLTVCSGYSRLSDWVLREDWSALLDVAPSMANMYWTLAIASILINSVSLFPSNPPEDTPL